MITKIENISSKSFDNFSSDDEFSTINVLFGTNGSGKSGLAEWLAKQKPETSSIFDTKYVQENIATKDELSGVKLIVGNERIIHEKNIENIRTANENIEQQQKNIKTELEKNKNDVYQIIQDTLTKARENFKLNKNINQKRGAKEDPISVLEQWIREIKEESLLGNDSSSAELETSKERITRELHELKIIFTLTEDEFMELTNILDTKVPVPNEAVTNEVIEWLKKGLLLHNTDLHDETCKFCGNGFDAVKISKEIQEKISTKHASTVKKLDELKNKMTQSRENAFSLSEKNEVTEFIKEAESIIQSIENKIDNTNQSISLSNISFDDLSKLDKELLVVKKEKENNLEKIDKQINQIEVVAKSWIGRELQQNQQVIRAKDMIRKLASKNEELEKARIENIEWISEKEKSSSDLQPFCEVINREFSIVGFDFTVEIMENGTNYLIKHKNPQIKLKMQDLSEGEKRLLGFLHFYYSLFDEVDKSVKTKIETIIVDDPITSLDIDNRYYLTTKLNHFIKKCKELDKQIFIFTHSSLDFHNIGYGERANYWKIFRNINGTSEIQKSKNDGNYSDYYRTNFRELFRFAILSRNRLRADNVLLYGNKARLVLESHARTHYDIQNTTKNNYKKIKEYYEIRDDKDEEVRRMLDVINDLSHGKTLLDDNPISNKEVQDNIRVMFSVLYNKDKFHVKQMVEQLWSNENKQNILNWIEWGDSNG